jgi:hypothetical protein
MDFERMMKDALEGMEMPPMDDSTWDAPNNPAQAVEELIEATQEAMARSLFSPGDIVTPQKNSNLKGRGAPHIVIRKTALTWQCIGDGKPSMPQDIYYGVMIHGVFKVYAGYSGRLSTYSPTYDYENDRDKDDSWKIPRNSSAAIETLNDEAQVWLHPAPCTFAVGDIVTPKKSATNNKKGRGKPHYVTDKFPTKFMVYEPGCPVEQLNFVTTLDLGDPILISFENNAAEYELFDVNMDY